MVLRTGQIKQLLHLLTSFVALNNKNIVLPLKQQQNVALLTNPFFRKEHTCRAHYIPSFSFKLGYVITQQIVSTMEE